MKKAFRVGGILILGIIAIAGIFGAYVAVRGIPHYKVPPLEFRAQSTPERIARGRILTLLLCNSCHFDPATGALTGKQMADVPAEFGTIYAPNITHDAIHGIGAWRDGELLYLLRTGVRRDGRYEPPYMIKMPHAADEDLDAIIAFLRSDDALVKPSSVASRAPQPTFLVKLLCYVAFKPLPYPAKPIHIPEKSDRVAYGRYLANDLLGCFDCHSADFKTNDPLVPERSAGFYGGGNHFRGPDGLTIQAANITPEPNAGIGSWKEADFFRAMKLGFRPDRSPLRHPMPLYGNLDDNGISAIFAYLRTVPPLPTAITRKLPAGTEPSSPGQKIYRKYGCDGCHGDAGNDPIDLRGAGRKYPTDAELIAYLKRPAGGGESAQMPAFEGVIGEDEFAPLAQYVRMLFRENQEK